MTRVRPDFGGSGSFDGNCRALAWLRDHCYSRLTKWEQQFVDDLGDRVDNGDVRYFTPKQVEVIDRMWEEHVAGRR